MPSASNNPVNQSIISSLLIKGRGIGKPFFSDKLTDTELKTCDPPCFNLASLASLGLINSWPLPLGTSLIHLFAQGNSIDNNSNESSLYQEYTTKHITMLNITHANTANIRLLAKTWLIDFNKVSTPHTNLEHTPRGDCP